jgi:hypothetical protein
MGLSGSQALTCLAAGILLCALRKSEAICVLFADLFVIFAVGRLERELEKGLGGLLGGVRSGVRGFYV